MEPNTGGETSQGLKEKKSNEYPLLNFKKDSESDENFGSQNIVFYEMNEDGSFDNGTTIEEMIRVSVERLEDLNGRFPSDFNQRARVALNEALKHLNERTADRVARGVEGKHEA